jgi:hypothetical protein
MTAVEWLSNRAYELFEEYSEGKFDRITLNKLMVEATDQAKEMEKEQKHRDFTDGYMHGSEREPLNHDVIDKWYNETYGGNK